MIKVLRVNIELTIKECYDLIDFFQNRISDIKILKKVSVIDNENEFIFNVKIQSKAKAVILYICNECNDILMYRDDFTELCKGLYDLLGIRCHEYFTFCSNEKNCSYIFYFNIDKICDIGDYFSIYKYYRGKLNRLKKTLKDNNYKTLMEIVYADFKYEKEVALATYCLLANPFTLIFNDDLVKTYEDKLFYIGVELDDYIGKWQNYSVDDIDMVLYKKDKKDILELMISYVAFVRGNKNVNYNEVLNIGYSLYNSYIKLLKF